MYSVTINSVDTMRSIRNLNLNHGNKKLPFLLLLRPSFPRNSFSPIWLVPTTKKAIVRLLIRADALHRLSRQLDVSHDTGQKIGLWSTRKRTQREKEGETQYHGDGNSSYASWHHLWYRAFPRWRDGLRLLHYVCASIIGAPRSWIRLILSYIGKTTVST